MRDPSWYELVATWLRRSAVPLGAVLLLIVVVDHGLPSDSPLSQTAGYSALALLFGFFILSVVDPLKSNVWLRRVVESGWLRFFGKYSYGIYVLHWPIHLLGKLWPLRLVAYITGNLVASTAAAVAVWNLVERRFLALKDVWGRRDTAAGKDHL
jgi:peptidoglycan/LPS O-acetylase OafA/YrhL